MQRSLFALLLGLALLSLLANLLSFGGDPEIHLVFAQNLLRGYPLQFNPGSYTSGETSPLYMALLAGVLFVVGLPATAVFMKLLGVASGFGLLVAVREASASALPSRREATLVAGALAAAPFFFFQAQLGMENLPFALLLAWLVRRLVRAESLIPISAAAHVLFFLRPEAMFLIAAVYAAAFLDRRRRLQTLAVSLGFSSVVAATVFGLERASGVALYGGAAMRVVSSSLDAFAIPGTPLVLNARPLIFVAYAWPLLGAIALRRREVPRLYWIVLTSLVGAPFALHLFNFFPNTHFTRYSLYFWFPLLLVALTALRSEPAAARLAVTVFAINAACVGAGELAMRVREKSFANTHLVRTLALRSRQEVARVSDALCAQLDCSKPPVRVALYEVQLRLRLDERFEVHSLDGVVDAGMRRFVTQNGEIDLVGYLEAEDVDLVLDLPASHPPGQPSLWEIYERAAMGPVQVGHSVFERRELHGGVQTKALARSSLVQHSSRVSRL